MKPRIEHLYIVIILLFFTLNAVHLFKGGILFHEDIARDFIILEELVSANKLTLIGPKTGVIPGFFHGPLWYYINYPVFYLSDGDPFILAIYWYLLYLVGILSLGYFYKKISDDKTALTALVLLLGMTTFMPARMWQESPAVFLALPFFVFMWRYFTKFNVKDLVFAWLLLGLIIHSQIAFGAPILFISILLVLKNKKWKHATSLAIILVPLGTYILFDLRHDFLQLRSIAQYVSNPSPTVHSSTSEWLSQRLEDILETFKLIKVHISYHHKQPTDWINLNARLLELFGAVVGLIGLGFTHFGIRKDTQTRVAWNLTLWYIVGYWIITFFWKKPIPWYYTEPFLPILIFWWARISTNKHKHKMLTYALIFLVSIFNLAATFFTAGSLIKEPLKYQGDWGTHWEYYHKIAQDVVANSAGRDFGYFTWTESFYSYQPKYAMLFLKNTSGVEMCHFCKKSLTYLLVEPDFPYFNWGNADEWRIQQVGITRAADEMWTYPGTAMYPEEYKVLKYNLNQEEVAIPVDSLIDSRAIKR